MQAQLKSVVLEGDDHFETTVLKPRREGYGLIDPRRQDIVFTTEW